MFTGKSSVGRRLGRKLKLEFVDIDELIARQAEQTIPEIFSTRGEKAFREIEQDVLERELASQGRIFSTGGGVVTVRRNRELLLRHSCVIWLTASPETVLRRFRESRGKPRPLLQVDDPGARIRQLLAERESCYEECDLRVNTDGKSVRQVADEITKMLNAGE